MRFTSLLSRHLWAPIAMVLVLGSSGAYADTPAEIYIRDNVQKGLSILNDTALSREAKRAQFQAFLEGLTDVHRIAIFTLGAAAKSAPPADVEAFAQAFRSYAAAVYQQQLAHYSGQTLKITGSIERAPGDFIVRTVVQQTTGAAGDEVDFRVENTDGKLVVIDASVMGVWLAVQERDQFTAFLAQHNADVKALTADLEKRAEAIRSGSVRGN